MLLAHGTTVDLPFQATEMLVGRGLQVNRKLDQMRARIRVAARPACLSSLNFRGVQKPRNVLRLFRTIRWPNRVVLDRAPQPTTIKG